MRRSFALSLALLRLVLLVSTATEEDYTDLDARLDNILNESPDADPGPGSAPTTAPPASCRQGQRCVKKPLCRNESASETLIDIQSNESNPCVDYLLQCCYEEDIIATIPQNVEIRNGENPVCGRRNPEGIAFRIQAVGNYESEYGEFPWMVAVLSVFHVGDQSVNAYHCGGSLIHPSVVLTAVHYVKNLKPEDLKIRAGEWDTQTENEIYPYQDREVVEIVGHPNFHKGGLFNDIALIILKAPVDFNDVIQPVCLPPPNTKFDRERCFVSGWGKNAFGKEGVYQAILKKIDLPIIPHTECQDALRKSRSQPGFTVHDSFVCAGGEVGKDACKGDGGSPLVCPIPGSGEKYYQVGIVAWGIGCGEGTPGLYADVSHLRNWIDQEMRKRDLDTNSYTAS